MNPFEIHKYPRTPHIEGSRLQSGDEDLSQIPFSEIAGKNLVIEEKCDGKAIVYDIYGNPHDVVKENIKYIFTKSQFKLH